MELKDKFNTYSDSKLLSIIDKPHEYQAQAVEVAKEILSKRNLSEEKIQSAKECLEKEKSIKHVNEVRLNLIQKYLAKKGKLHANGAMHTEWILKILSIALWSIFIVLLTLGVVLIVVNNMNRTEEVDIMAYYFFPPSIFSPLIYILLYSFPFLALLTAIVLFNKRKKIGYILVALFLTYCSVSTIKVLISNINTGFFNLTLLSITCSILSLLLLGGLLWLLSKKHVRTVYSVSVQEMYVTIFFASLVCLGN